MSVGLGSGSGEGSGAGVGAGGGTSAGAGTDVGVDLRAGGAGMVDGWAAEVGNRVWEDSCMKELAPSRRANHRGGLISGRRGSPPPKT